MLNLNEIEKARIRIDSYIHNSPVLTNSTLNKITNAELYFKCENFQKSGSFKIRGAANAVLQLMPDELNSGIVTASSGNHGAALSMIASKLGLKIKVVMPKNTSKIKIDNVKRNGGEIVWCDSNQKSRDKILNKVIKKTKSTLIHPYNNKHIIAGQGTVALELMEKYTDLDCVIAPISGGGLLSGTICLIEGMNTKTTVYGAEPAEADDAYRSILSGKIEINDTTNTICDGLRAQLGSITFPIIKKGVEKIFTLDENEIKYSMRLVWETMKIIVEPSCSIALAAVLKNKKIFEGKKVGLILSGGNVDLDHLPW